MSFPIYLDTALGAYTTNGGVFFPGLTYDDVEHYMEGAVLALGAGYFYNLTADSDDHACIDVSTITVTTPTIGGVQGVLLVNQNTSYPLSVNTSTHELTNSEPALQTNGQPFVRGRSGVS